MTKNEEMQDVDQKASDLKASIDERIKAEKAKADALAKLLTVSSARRSPLRAGIWYITLSSGKVLNTKVKAHLDAALKLIAGKIPVTYKEAKDATDGKYWLTEIKAAA